MCSAEYVTHEDEERMQICERPVLNERTMDNVQNWDSYDISLFAHHIAWGHIHYIFNDSSIDNMFYE